MTHAMVTVIAPIALSRVDSLQRQISKLGNPARAELTEKLRARDGDEGTHFASLHAIASGQGDRGFLVLEFSADGTEDRALERIVRAIGPELKDIFAQADDWDSEPHAERFASYLRKHRVPVGHGWFSSPGLCFAGTPGMSVGRIAKEAELAAEVARLLREQPGDRRAIERLHDVRTAVRAKPNFTWAFETPPPLPPPPDALPTWQLVLSLLLAFARLYLWPLGLAALAWSIFTAVRAADGSLTLAASTFSLTLLVVTFWAALLIAAGLVVLYLLLLRAEERDWISERAPDRATLAAIFARENHGAQNHMASVTARKPGLLRAMTIRVVFWMIGELATRLFRPGFLSGIGTIHFARWVTPPGTRDLLFFSNYGGSWESYLEDFITRANHGLTAVWSNTMGFPRTSSLIFQGAADGERFKRYARQSMQPTPFWFSAYPDVTTSLIRANASIRLGLTAALSDDEAQSWLALFGSAQRPDSKLESSDIQSLVFGGLGFMPCGVCLVFDLPVERDGAQQWIADLAPVVAFNDGRRLGRKAVATIGLSPRALEKLGLPDECVSTFPAAFLDTMPKRAKVLGDIGANAVENWRWGQETPDALLLVYGDTDGDVADLEAQIKTLGLAPKYRVALKPVESGKVKKEPFGFVDGISQPLIRGSYKALREPSPLHVVEPGEFVIGYPDNRGRIPPAPTLAAKLDPDNVLPIAAPSHDFTVEIADRPRDIARNGAFLVIRQLEQDVQGFYEYCEDEAQAQRAAGRLGPPYNVDQEFIAAKLVGRWKDGSSLVRHPYMTASEELKGKKEVERLAMARDPQQYATRAQAVDEAPSPDNEFLFGTEDPEGLRCPYGAHIRRANPRESFDPGSPAQIAISNRHRLLRVGRFYEPEPNRDPGLFFMCVNGDIERQFEFIQQTWLNSPTFHGLVGEQDPIVGTCEPKGTGYVVPTRDGPMQLSPLRRFVTTLGGGYFFLPGKRLLRFLGADRKPAIALAARAKEQRLA